MENVIVAIDFVLIRTAPVADDAVDLRPQIGYRVQVEQLLFVVAELDDTPAQIDEIDLAFVALLILIDQATHGVNREADAGGPDVIVRVIEDAVVDEDGQCVGIGKIGVNVDLVVLGHAAHTVVPGVARFEGRHALESAFGGVVGATLVRNEEAAESAMALFHFLEESGHVRQGFLTAQDPVAHESVVCHRHRDQDRADQIALDFRVNVARGQRQVLRDDGLADGLLGNEVADHRHGNEANR